MALSKSVQLSGLVYSSVGQTVFSEISLPALKIKVFAMSVECNRKKTEEVNEKKRGYCFHDVHVCALGFLL